MRACDQCLENNWNYQYNDGYIIATCNQCGYEIEFKTKKRESIKIGDKCRKCGGKIIIRKSKFKQSKLKKPYYYTAYYYCPECRTKYMAEEFKIINKQGYPQLDLTRVGIGYIMVLDNN